MDATADHCVCLAKTLGHSGYCVSMLAQTRRSQLQRVLLVASRLLSLSGDVAARFCFKSVLPTHPHPTAPAECLLPFSFTVLSLFVNVA